jgi:hypothetical protein
MGQLKGLLHSTPCDHAKGDLLISMDQICIDQNLKMQIVPAQHLRFRGMFFGIITHSYPLQSVLGFF